MRLQCSVRCAQPVAASLLWQRAAPLPCWRRVNVVLPGWIDTSGDPMSLSAADHAWHLTGRVGRPEDVAELCLFLGDTGKAGFITG